MLHFDATNATTLTATNFVGNLTGNIHLDVTPNLAIGVMDDGFVSLVIMLQDRLGGQVI